MPLALEYGTWHWHLPTAKVQMSLANGTRRGHHEIRPQTASSSDPPTTGSSGDPRVTDPRSLAHWASREPAIEPGGPAYHRTHRVRYARAHAYLPGTEGRDIAFREDSQLSTAQSPETPMGRCCHTDPSKHHPS